MPEFNANQVVEPIVVRLGDETFTVESVSQDMIEKVQANAEIFDSGKPDAIKKAMRSTFETIFGRVPDNFNLLDVRAIRAAIEFVFSETEKDFDNRKKKSRKSR